MNHSGGFVKCVFGFFVATTVLFIVPEDLRVTSFAKDYPSVFHTLKNSFQYHVSTTFSPSKFDVNFRLHNTTDMISLVGYVNVGKLTVHKFKPFVFAGPTASFLTKNYAAYRAAKNISETLRPATKVFQIHHPSSSSSSKDSRLNHSPMSQTSPSPLTVAFEGLQQNCCVPPDVQLAAGLQGELSDSSQKRIVFPL